MLGYVVPLTQFADTYNGEPLSIVSLANRKKHIAVCLTGVQGDEHEPAVVRRCLARLGQLDMGESCVRVTTIEHVALDVRSEVASRVMPVRLIAANQAAHPSWPRGVQGRRCSCGARRRFTPAPFRGNLAKRE